MIYIIPIIMISITVFALKNGTDVYSLFCEGVGNGMKTVFDIFPAILAISVGFSMMRASGLLDFLILSIRPFSDFFNIPPEILPLAVIRPISGSGALGVLSDILKKYGADSYIGVLASIIMGSTETTFYTLMVYFKNTRVKYTKCVIPAALFGDIVGVTVGVVAGTIIF